MKLPKSGQVMLGIVIVLSVLAIGGVILGNCLHEEAGLDERMPRWQPDDMPLGVCVQAYSRPVETRDLESARHAIDVTNSRLGFVAYEVRTNECDVFLRHGEPAEAGWIDPGGNAYVVGQQCFAATVNVIGEVEQLTVQHELGHCLGLAHDDFEMSIMRPVQSETPMGSLPPWITDHDRALLREMYAP